ncbi:MAG: NAD(P)/FAD-dependent oxidoreductase, partial [Gammaproteobacteria bacterium]
YQGDALVVATGTYERIVPFPGWTLPGVIGVGAATLLVKGQQVLPGRRTVVAGCGPLLPVAAAAIVKAGGAIAAYVDLNGPGELLRALPALATWPGRLAYGLGLLRDIRRSGAPMLGRHAVVEVRGRHGVEEVRVASVGPDGRPHPRSTMRMFAADALAIGHGLIPATEITQLLGATHAYRRESGGWVPITQDRVRTSVPGLYVAGDGAGVTGASAAVLHGRLAGLAVVRDAGRLSDQAHDRRAAEIRRALAWDERFARGVRRMMQAPEGLLDLMTPQTIVCRCEDLTRNDIDYAVARGARGMNELKAWTRCGMGPCQGRTCGETAAELVAARVGSRENTGRWTPRPPIRPIPIDILAGEFAYGDIVLPPQAPA